MFELLGVLLCIGRRFLAATRLLISDAAFISVSSQYNGSEKRAVLLMGNYSKEEKKRKTHRQIDFRNQNFDLSTLTFNVFREREMDTEAKKQCPVLSQRVSIYHDLLVIS